MLILISNTFAKDTGMLVVSNSSYLALYKSRDRAPSDKAIYRVTNKDILSVVSIRGSSYLVKTAKGYKGWVKKWFVRDIASLDKYTNVSAKKDVSLLEK